MGGIGRLRSFRFGGFVFGGVGHRTVAEAPRCIAGFHDMAVMRQAIQQCGGHLRIGKDTAPFPEAQVRGDEHTGALIEL